MADCSNDFETRMTINDATLRAGKPAVFASVNLFEGQLQVVVPADGTACLRCRRPDVPPAPVAGNSEQAGVLGAAPGVIGAMQAMETLELLLELPGLLAGEVALLDLLSMQMRKLRVARDPSCVACGAIP